MFTTACLTAFFIYVLYMNRPLRTLDALVLSDRDYLLPDYLSSWVSNDGFTTHKDLIYDGSVLVREIPIGYLVRPDGHCFKFQYETYFGFGCGNLGYTATRTALVVTEPLLLWFITLVICVVTAHRILHHQWL